jgi:uncharacterized protein
MIDYWCNAFTPDRSSLWKQVIEQDQLAIKLGAREADDFVDAAGMVARMDHAAIATLVLPVCEIADGAALDEFAHYALRTTEIQQLAASHPGRFVGVFSVNPDEPADVEAAELALHSSWCVGLHNHTHSWNHTFDASVFEAYYELAATHGVPFVVQAGRSGGHRDHELGHPRAMIGPANRFPTVQFVLSHLGLPWLTETIQTALEHDNIVLGTATHPPRRWPDEFVDFIRGPGSRRTLFGTGYPLTGHLHVQSQLDALDLPDAAKEALREGNARRIFTRIPARFGG